MMRQLFNNKWFIIALAAGSVLLMGRSIIVEVWNTSDVGEYVEEDPYDGIDMEDEFDDRFDDLGNAAGDFFEQLTSRQSKADADPARTVHHRRLTWNNEPRRDPFKVQMEAEPPAAVSLASVGTVAPQSGPPRLAALVAGPASSYAVFGDRVVTEGDHVEGYRIVRITPDGVRVASKQGSTWLPIPGTGLAKPE